jgi:hypothetical protein
MMKKISIIFTFIIITFCCRINAASDTIYFYKSGTIVYQKAVNLIDSITFVPINYYDMKRSEDVYKKILSYPQLSKFAEILKITGYDKYLYNKTIWAPENSSISSVDIKDTTALIKILRNHISNEKVTTLDAKNKRVKMLNNKYLIYTRTENKYTIDGKICILSNISSKGSYIHIINEEIPYKLNIWEFLNLTNVEDGYDTFRAYVRSMLSEDDNGNTVNDVLRYLGQLNNEDYDCTAIIPDDAACEEAFNLLYSKFSTAKENADSSKLIENIKWRIVRDQFFNPSIKQLPVNGIINSTFGIPYDARILLKEENIVSLNNFSNGSVIFVRSLNMLDSMVLNKTKKIECENNYYRNSINCDLNTISVNDVKYDISGNQYLKCIPISTSNLAKISVSYGIQDLIPGKYNIYAYTVPACIEDTIDKKPNKLNFYITHDDGLSINVINKNLLSNFVTDSTSTTKIKLAENYTIPVVYYQHDPLKVPNEKLRIENAVFISQLKTFNRVFRIDCLVFERIE